MFTHGRILKPLKTRTTGGLGKIFCFVQTKIRFRNKKTKKNKQKCEECPWVAQSAHSEHGPFWTWRILKMQHNVFCITSTHVLMPLYQIFICGEGASRVRKRNVMKKVAFDTDELELENCCCAIRVKKNDARFCCQLWLMKWVDFRPERAILLSAFEIIIIWHEMTKMLILLYWFRIGKKGSPTGLADIAHW